MATLDITLQGVTADSTISIRVQLNGVEKHSPRAERLGNREGKRGRINLPSDKNKKRASPTKSISARSPDRLLATDRIVLDALRARLSEGSTETPPVRVRELMGECSISRRQVGICLKRLNEKGQILRVGNGKLAGTTEGFRYRILKLT